MPLVLRRIPESAGTDAALDIPGLALVTGAALALVWGLMRGNGAGWASTEVVGALAAGCLLTAGFVIWERQAGQAMVPLRFFRGPAFSSAIAPSFFFYAAMYRALFLLPPVSPAAQGQ